MLLSVRVEVKLGAADFAAIETFPLLVSVHLLHVFLLGIARKESLVASVALVDGLVAGEQGLVPVDGQQVAVQMRALLNGFLAVRTFVGVQLEMNALDVFAERVSVRQFGAADSADGAQI